MSLDDQTNKLQKPNRIQHQHPFITALLYSFFCYNPSGLFFTKCQYVLLESESKKITYIYIP